MSYLVRRLFRRLCLYYGSIFLVGATTAERMPLEDSQQAKSTIAAIKIAGLRGNRVLPIGIGNFSKELDTALPGTHTRILYNGLKKKEAKVLV